jgi:hypothetical protein
VLTEIATPTTGKIAPIIGIIALKTGKIARKIGIIALAILETLTSFAIIKAMQTVTRFQKLMAVSIFTIPMATVAGICHLLGSVIMNRLING